MLQNVGGDVVHTTMMTVDDKGLEKVARRHGALDISHFRASRAGLIQREKKRTFVRATSVQNVFDVLADHNDDTDDVSDVLADHNDNNDDVSDDDDRRR